MGDLTTLTSAAAVRGRGRAAFTAAPDLEIAPASVRPSYGAQFCSPAPYPLYLTGASGPASRAAGPSARGLGLLVTPASGLARQIGAYHSFAADNGCYAQGEQFNANAWLAWLATLPRQNCLFAVAPDVVGNAAATRRRSVPYLPLVRDLGFPVAYVAQDGATARTLPWDDFDALFLGGSTEFKLSSTARELVAIALAHGKWTHCGRVNSWRRFTLMASWGVDSVDGTYLAFGPHRNLPRLLSWLEQAERNSYPTGQQYRFRQRLGMTRVGGDQLGCAGPSITVADARTAAALWAAAVTFTAAVKPECETTVAGRFSRRWRPANRAALTGSFLRTFDPQRPSPGLVDRQEAGQGDAGQLERFAALMATARDAVLWSPTTTTRLSRWPKTASTQVGPGSIAAQ